MAATVFGLGGAGVCTAAGIGHGFGGRKVPVGIALGVLVVVAAVALYVHTFHVLVDRSG